MARNLKKFIGLTILITLGLIFMPMAVDLLPEKFQGFASLAVIIVDFWVVFDLIVQIIYKMAGIQGSNHRHKRLTHQQAEAINKYWMAWLFTSLATASTYVMLFDRNWKNSLFLIGGGFVAIALVSINNKQRIMGHTKKELFK